MKGRAGLRLWALAGAGLLVVAVAALAATWRPVIAEIAPPAPSSFAADAVARGAALSRIGDCGVCHTEPGGAPYAGGRAIRTPFGVVYSPNLTPDAATGIGGWPQAAFARALRDGVGRRGERLYPALPYDHYTRLSDGEIADLYAFHMTRRAVRATAPPNRLVPPLGFRPLLAGWQLLFLRRGREVEDASRGVEWNRGRHLAEALGHCNACHGPRNALGAEVRSRAYAGGWSDGWWAPPLGASSPAVRAWTPERMYTYLRTGLEAHHAAAAGPMGPVTRGLSEAPEADVRALALYAASLMAQAPASRAEPATPDHAAAAARAHPQGAAIYAGACAACHEAGGGMMLEGRPPLPLGTPLHEANGRDVVQIVLQGLAPPVGRAGPYMPAFRDSLSDAQVAEVAAYLRARFHAGAPWPDLPREVARARKEGLAP